MNSFLSIFPPTLFYIGITFLIISYLIFLLWKNILYSLKENSRAKDLQFIEVKVPKQDGKEDKENVGNEYGSSKDFIKIATTMNQLYSSLSSIGSSSFLSTKIYNQNYFIQEYYVEEGLIKFVLGFPSDFISSAIKQISAIYPTSVINPIKRPSIKREGRKYSGVNLYLSEDYVYPIKTMEDMNADPINNIINSLSKVKNTDSVAFQILLRPINLDWVSYSEVILDVLKNGEKTSLLKKLLFFPFYILKFIFELLFKGEVSKEEEKKDDSSKDISTITQEKISNIEKKIKNSAYDIVIRIVAGAEKKEVAEEYVGDVYNSLAPYDLKGGNGFTDPDYFSLQSLINNYEEKNMNRPFLSWTLKNFFSSKYNSIQVMSYDEITSLYHLPSYQYNPSSSIDWQGFKMTPAPHDMPENGLLLGINNYRGVNTNVYIRPNDRMRHFYLIGKSGTGKSTILEQMIRQDMKNGNGLCVVDPHGDLVEAVLPYVPRDRAEDVIVFDPGDSERPMGVNILEAKGEDEKEFMANEAMAIFIKLYGEEIFGPRLQNYFINAVHTLMSDDDDPATVLDILRMFTDDAYRTEKVKKVTKPSVKAFWEQEYAKSGDKEKQEIIPYLAAKFTPFVTNTQIRNIIGQGKSGFNFSEVMDNKKILLVNLSKGKLGDLNSRLLGMIFVSKMQMAAMGRVKIPEKDRSDFYLYVDEFQNFVTESFASILSEARKYRLGLIVAHQYISQITKMQGGGKGSHEDHTIKDAVFGNVGSMMCFKIGSQDAEHMVKEFQPVFSETDLINIINYHAFIKLNINNTTSAGFVMKTIYDESGADKEAALAYKELSRLKFGRDRSFVEREVKRKMIGGTSGPPKGMEDAFKQSIF
jgi:hypothetical protein